MFRIEWILNVAISELGISGLAAQSLEEKSGILIECSLCWQ
jgi:hypothetical protein